ncbi:MAG: hypothetical protein JWQ59_456 [Cryobacterium sp.]|nr:hypothetical protein [Cryobacterium sp.]
MQNGVELVLIAGDVRARQLVREALDGTVGSTTVELDAGGRSADGGDEALQRAVATALEEVLSTTRLAQSDELHERLGRDDSVAIGIRDLVDAFVRGQVDRLLIDPANAAQFVVEPQHHPGLSLGAVSPMPPTVPADAALIAAAALTGAEIVVTPGQLLSGSPAAGLLRWGQPSTQA